MKIKVCTFIVLTFLIHLSLSSWQSDITASATVKSRSQNTGGSSKTSTSSPTSSSPSSSTSSSNKPSVESSLIGFLIGPILFVSSFMIIWFNERKAAIEYRRLSLAQQMCKDANPYSFQNGDINNSLICVVGQTLSSEILKDDVSGVESSNCIYLRRKVEVMQYRAHQKKQGDQTKITYDLDWRENNQPHAGDYTNDLGNWFLQPIDIIADHVMVGSMELSEAQKQMCKKNQLIHPSQAHANCIIQNIGKHNLNSMLKQDYIYFSSPYDGQMTSHGSLRVQYSRCPIGPITIMAQSRDNTFIPFPIFKYDKNGVKEIEEKDPQLGCCCCFGLIKNKIKFLLKPIQQINFLEEEKLSKHEIVQKNMKQARQIAQLMRIISYVIMVIGVCLFFSPISTIIGYIPLIGKPIASFVFFIIFLAACLACIPLWTLATGISWACFNPKIGFTLIGMGCFLMYILISYSNSGTKQVIV